MSVHFGEESDCRLAVTLGAADKGAGRAERGLRTEEVLPPFRYLARVWQAEINNKIIHTEEVFVCSHVCVCVPAHVLMRVHECIYVCLCVGVLR